MLTETHEITINLSHDLILPGDNKYWVYDYRQVRIDSILQSFTDYRMLLILLGIFIASFLAFKYLHGRKFTKKFH